MKNNRGITLIALVITVILMLMLVGVVVTNIRDGGLFNHAKRAVRNTEISSEKVAIQQAAVIAIGMNKQGRITDSNFQSALNGQVGEEGSAIVYNNGDDFIVEFTKTERFYQVDNNGNVGDPITIEPLENAGDITKGGQYNGQTKETAYRIECIEDLVNLSAIVAQKKSNSNSSEVIRSNTYCVLTKDLDFNSIFSYSNFKAKYIYDEDLNAYIPDEESKTAKPIKELCTTGQGFIPIGLNYGQGSKDFAGVFDGQNYEIKNIYINTANNAALFGGAYGATIRNLTINGTITCTGSNYAAGILANQSGCKIKNCCNKATVTSKGSFAGGMCGSGYMLSELDSCINYGNITGSGGVCGICGGSSGPAIKKCVNYGNILAGGGQAHGIGMGSKLINCANYGDVYGDHVCSGCGPKTLRNCINYGSVKCKGTNRVSLISGALGLGDWGAGTFYNCVNCGDVKMEKPNASCDHNYVVGYATEENMINGYYYNGINIGSEVKIGSNVNSFELEDAQDVVDVLNTYIENHKDDEDTATNTSDWLKWRVGRNGLPELIFE